MTELPVLTPQEQRVLGVLLEKERTVPASYPMTLNALRTGCNQASSRDPVVDYDEQTVETTARGLRDRELLRVVWGGAGQRTLKYHQRLAERLELPADERALITVLLLRGPQTAGELRTRTDRLHAFADRGAVEEVLTRMADRSTPLVRELARQPGQHDPRWVHLLGPLPEVATSGSAPADDHAATEREGVLDQGAEHRDDIVRAGYGRLAGVYAEKFAGMAGVPDFELWLLKQAARAAGRLPVADVGCGPGHTTAVLAGHRATVTGFDLSPQMIEEARRRYPSLSFAVGDLRRLMRPVDADGWGAVLAWYSLIHLAPSELPEAIAALARPLTPGGLLVIAVQAARAGGPAVRVAHEWLDVELDEGLSFVLHEPADVRAAVEAAGLVDVQWYLRGPVPALEETTDRFYLLARKPGD